MFRQKNIHLFHTYHKTSNYKTNFHSGTELGRGTLAGLKTKRPQCLVSKFPSATS